MEFVLNTLELPDGLEPKRLGSTHHQHVLDEDGVEIEVQYLVSATRDLGQGVVSCISGCECKSMSLKGKVPIPQDDIGGVRVRLAKVDSRCRIRVESTGLMHLMGIKIHWNDAVEPVLAL